MPPDRHERPVAQSAAAPRSSAERTPAAGPGRPSAVLDLQRKAGNQATAGLIRQVSAAPDDQAPPDLVPTDPHEPRERAADEAADALTAGGPAGDGNAPRPGSPPPAPGSASGPALPGLGSGQPLPDELRSRFEAFFGPDLGEVRIHAHPAGARMAEALDASAFTVGRDVVFGAGRFRPGTRAGDRLLAHELAHVVAGHSAGAPRTALRQAMKTDQAAGQPRGTLFFFTVRLSGTPLDSDALLTEFVRQYYRLASAADAARMRDQGGWEWTGTPPVVTGVDLRRGYIRVVVRDVSTPVVSAEEHKQRDEYFAQLPGGEQADINAQADRLFWDRTRYRPGERLGRGPVDQVMAPYWRALRDELVRQRKAIADLPPSVRDLLFADTGQPLTPDAYGDVLRIAGKLLTLSRAELAELQDRLSLQAATGDRAAFERYVDGYLAERAARRNAGEDRERLASRLTGLKPLYDRYRDLIGLQYTSGMTLAAPGAAGMPGVEAASVPVPVTLWTRFTADLREAGFDSVADFVAAITAWREAFRAETVAIGRDLLDRYERTLTRAERVYRAPGAPARLYQQLTPGRQHYVEADRISQEFFDTGGTVMPWTPDELAYSEQYQGRRNEQLDQGSAAVRTLATELPIVAEPDFPRQDLAMRPEGGVVSVLRDYVGARREDIAKTRGNLASGPDMVFGLDRLLEASYQAQDIKPGSIFDQIVRDYAHDLAVEKAIITLGIAVIAIALGVVSGGTGTAAVLAATGVAGIGVASAIQEYRSYEEQSAAHGAQLLSDDPSFAWVIVAVVGAGLDVGGAVSAFRASAGLRTAVQSFNETRDLARFRQQVEQLAEVDEKLRRTLVAAGEAQKAEEALAAERLAEWFPKGAARASLFLLDRPVELAVRLAYGTYLTARRGVRSFRRFLLQREAAALFGDVSKLSPAQLSRLGVAYEDALAISARVTQHGQALGMSEEQIEYFFRLWTRNEHMPADQLMAQMSDWTANLGGGAGRYRTAPDIVLDPRSRAVLPDFDRRIAGTGGIERVTAARVPEEGRLSVTIEGEIRPGLARRAESAAPGRARAPDFNRSRGNVFSNAELGLSDDWEVLHLWGPGFGDEAAAGMMRGPKSVNHFWQNEGIESYVRQLGEQARRDGGTARLKATAVAWETPTPKGWHAPRGELFLKRAQYEVTLVLPGKPSQTVRVTLETAEPPVSKLAHWSFDPPGAIDLASLF